LRRVACFTQIPTTVVAEKSGSMFFWPKIPIKNFRNHDKSIQSLKKLENRLQNRTRPKTKNQPELISLFSWTFKVQKHLIWTPLIK
jgi:hypothetical protein